MTPSSPWSLFRRLSSRRNSIKFACLSVTKIIILVVILLTGLLVVFAALFADKGKSNVWDCVWFYAILGGTGICTILGIIEAINKPSSKKNDRETKKTPKTINLLAETNLDIPQRKSDLPEPSAATPPVVNTPVADQIDPGLFNIPQ